jgi:hypothetical protein
LLEIAFAVDSATPSNLKACKSTDFALDVYARD